MRFNAIFAAMFRASFRGLLRGPLLALFVVLSVIPLSAQVAPAARVGGLPIGISVGLGRYDLDYGPGRYMEGPMIRAGADVFHGLGVDLSARTIFMNTPPALTRMQQSTFLGGAFYEGKSFLRVRPFLRGAGGLGLIEFPSGNPNYTRDTYTVYALSGGVEYPIVDKVFFRAEYEYQDWKDYHGPRDLNPQGFTIGATYYLRGHHVRPHPMD